MNQNNNPVRSCPFAGRYDASCKNEGCKIFVDGKCSIATIADASGVEISENPVENSKCPFSIYGHCEECALYNKGCAIARIAAATNK